MMYRRRGFFLAVLGALLAMSCACTPAPAPDAVARISVLASGRLLLNGSPTDLAGIDAELQRQKTRGGVIWYYRETAQSEPPTEAMSVMELIIKHGLPVRMSTQPDFSDYIDGDGKARLRER
jgi:hypothetical protein